MSLENNHYHNQFQPTPSQSTGTSQAPAKGLEKFQEAVSQHAGRVFTWIKTIPSRIKSILTASLNQTVSLVKKESLSGEDKNIAKQFVNFTMKKPLHISGEKELHSEIHGDKSKRNLSAKLEVAKQFLEVCDGTHLTPEEKEGLQRIVQQRKISKEISEMEDPQRKGQDLADRVKNLSDPNSDRVVHLPNGGATFTIPGGRKGHYFSYEVQRVPDQNGGFRYNFVLHNRGSGLSDKELHGSFEAERGEGHRYMKTSVSIEVPQEALTAEFFEKLAASKESKTNSGPYGVMKEYLLAKGGGKIQFSEDEIACQKLSDELRSKASTLNSLETLKAIIGSPHANQAETLPNLPANIKSLLAQLKSDPGNQGLKNQILAEAENQIVSLRPEVGKLNQDFRQLEDKIIKENPSIHTVQNHGDCIESNRSEPEVQMAPNSLLKKLKLFTIQNLTVQVKNSSLPKEYKAVMEEASKKRQAKLKQEVQDTWSSKMGVAMAAKSGGILPHAKSSDRQGPPSYQQATSSPPSYQQATSSPPSYQEAISSPPSYQQATGGSSSQSPPLNGQHPAAGAAMQPEGTTDSTLTLHGAYIPDLNTSDDAKRFLNQPQFAIGHCILRFSKAQNMFYLCMKVDGGNIHQHPVDSKMDNRAVSDLINNFQNDYFRTRR